MTESIKRRLSAVAVTLALVATVARADKRPSHDGGNVVLSEGLRARISDGHLRSARLVFTDTSLTVEVDGDFPERFEYGELRILKGRHRMGLPLFSKWTWLVLLPPTGVSLATGGIGSGATYLLGALGITHGFYSWNRFSKRRVTHWLSLHTDSEHRCAFLALPRKEELRLAIFEELERRDKKELLVRPADPRRRRDLPPYPAIGEPAPDFALATIDSLPWRLSESKGKVVLLNFWATWCGPCRKELPHLERLHQRFSKDGLAVVGVSSEKPEDARRLLAEKGISYPSLHDLGSRVFGRFHVNAIPTSLIIGRDGTLRKRIEGYTNLGAFAKAVNPYLSLSREVPTR